MRSHKDITHPASMISNTIPTCTSTGKQPKYPTMYGEEQSFMNCSSRRICFRTEGFASTRMSYHGISAT